MPASVVRLLPGFALLGLAAAPFASAADALTPPLVRRACYDCHADGMDKGSFALDTLIAGGRDPKHRAQWLKVWKNVRHEFMPPADEAVQFTAAERRELTRWIEQNIFNVDPARPDPGVVTIRRLNRAEYNYTINDLLGTKLELREKLPPDDTAFGFDNIGEAQTLSPALLARFIDLASDVVNQAIVTTGRPVPVIPVALKVDPAETKRADQTATIEVAHPGRYKLRFEFTLGGWQDFGGDYRVRLLVDDRAVVDETLPLGGDADYEFPREVELTKGSHVVVLRAEPAKAELMPGAAIAGLVGTAEPIPTPAPAPVANANPNANANPDAAANPANALTPANAAKAGPGRGRRGPPPPPVISLNMRRLRVDFTGPLGAGIVADYPETHRKIFFRGDTPADAAGRSSYARDILRPLVTRAFRRPADENTLDRLVKVVLQDANFERGIAQALSAVLASPRFLFREEPQPEPDNPRASHSIDEHALASRLSYLFWLSFPDEELSALAAKGQLRANLAPQVRRMLADAKSKRFFEDFTGQWLRTRNILTAPITPERSSKLVDPVRKAMKDETDLLFEYVAREDRDLLELITADYTFVNQKLAEFYGIPGVTSAEMARVALPADTKRGGVLTHGSFLIATSNPNRTSPVKRGVFVLDNLFGTPPPAPPPTVPALEDVKKPGVELKTLRQQLAAHREDKSCAACHAHFDPLGLALENFSHIGQWRDQDGGEAVDASGQMVTGEKFADFGELRGLMAQRKDKFYRGLTEHLMTYTLGRGLEPYDAATVDRITDALMKNGGKFSTLITQLVESPAFQLRRGEGERGARATANGQ